MFVIIVQVFFEVLLGEIVKQARVVEIFYVDVCLWDLIVGCNEDFGVEADILSTLATLCALALSLTKAIWDGAL